MIYILLALAFVQSAIIISMAWLPCFGVLSEHGGRLALPVVRALNLLGLRFDVLLFDLDRLKQVNSATGAQQRTDELYRGAFQLRSTDLGLFFRTDAGDQFAIITRSGCGYGLAERLQAQLNAAPLTTQERDRLQLLTDGQMHQLSATFVLIEHAPDVVRAIKAGDQEAFTAKASGNRGQIVRG